MYTAILFTAHARGANSLHAAANVSTGLTRRTRFTSRRDKYPASNGPFSPRLPPDLGYRATISDAKKRERKREGHMAYVET